MLKWDSDFGQWYDDGQIDQTLVDYVPPTIIYGPDYDPTLSGYVPPAVTYAPGVEAQIAAIQAAAPALQGGDILGPPVPGFMDQVRSYLATAAESLKDPVGTFTGANLAKFNNENGIVIQAAEMPLIGGSGMATASEILQGVLGLAGSAQGQQLLGAVAGTGVAGAGGKLAGGTVVGSSHGLIQIKTTTGRVVWIKRAKKRRTSGRRGGGGGMGKMENMMIRLAMIKALK